MAPVITIRRFEIGDEPALFRVFHSAVHLVARRDYTQAQLDAWAPADLDRGAWTQRMRGIDPFIAQISDEIVGYADVQPSGYIDHFFVSGRKPRQGIGTALMNCIHEKARDIGIHQLTSDVSLTAQPFFARFGFVIVETKTVVLDGVAIPNALMRKRL